MEEYARAKFPVKLQKQLRFRDALSRIHMIYLLIIYILLVNKIIYKWPHLDIKT